MAGIHGRYYVATGKSDGRTCSYPEFTHAAWAEPILEED